MKSVPQDLFDYVVALRRRIHENPEVGFDLPVTARLVAEELDAMGIAHTDRFGQCSVVGYIGSREDLPTLGIRADMDALPVQEKTDLPYRSKVDGKMHACGHDAHTAVLLGVAKVLKEREAELPCNVRLFFQPSEEGAVSGGKMMVDNGAMEGVDEVIATHCENLLPAGTIGVHPGDYMAACIPVTIKFHGRTTHAALPHLGIDAVAMGVEAYSALRKMVAQEAGEKPYIWCNGYFAGGEVHNVVPDLCTMYISFRTYDLAFADRIMEKAKKICEDIAASYGGKADVQWHMSTGPVHNDENMQQRFERSIKPILPITQMAKKMSSEDFAWFLQKKPGMIFRFGTGNPELGCTAQAHRNDFKIDENGMKAAILAFVNFVLQYKYHKED